MEGDVSKVELGTQIIVTQTHFSGTTTKLDNPVVLEVVAPCPHADGGLWICATHGISFNTFLGKEIHIGRGGQHALAWMCLTCQTAQTP